MFVALVCLKVGRFDVCEIELNSIRYSYFLKGSDKLLLNTWVVKEVVVLLAFASTNGNVESLLHLNLDFVLGLDLA